MSLDENLELPRPFGPYTLLRRLAVGGMAEVYVGKTKGIGGFEKLVAIKVIHPRYSEDDHFITMLVEEAKISVLLNHVNIAQTFDLGCIDETYYIVMEFIEGADAYRVMRKCSDAKKALPIDVASFIASEMCAGLDYAHRKRDPMKQTPLGIVHRDISPQNILVSFAGEVKVVDFGIAKAASRSDHTEAGVIKGKYYYMSPEQAWGDPMDHRSDIFSTGVVLYELLTGRMLYNEDNIPLLLDKVRKAEIAPPEKRRPSIPKPLSDIVMRALQKDPADRYQSAQEMGHALAQFLYTTSPAFSAARLADLMAVLFPEENAKSSGLSTLPSSGEIALAEQKAAQEAALAPMKGLEYAPKKEQSKLYSLSDLGDEDEEDMTRNDVLPYRKVQQARQVAQKPAAKEPTPRPTNRPSAPGAVDRPSVAMDGSWVSPIRQPEVLTTNPLAAPANESTSTDQVNAQEEWEDPTYLRDQKPVSQLGPPIGGGGDDFDDSTLIDQKGLYQKVQQALEGKKVVESARGRVNAAWVRPSLGSADATGRQSPLASPAVQSRPASPAAIQSPSPSPVASPRPASVPPPPARAAWTARAPLPRPAAPPVGDQTRAFGPGGAPAQTPQQAQQPAQQQQQQQQQAQRQPQPQPQAQQAPPRIIVPIPSTAPMAARAGPSSHTPIAYQPGTEELTLPPLSTQMPVGYDSDISTRPKLGSLPPGYLPDDRTMPLPSSRIDPMIAAVRSPFPSGQSFPPPSSGSFPPQPASGSFAPPPSARPSQAGPWGSPSGNPAFDPRPQSPDPFAAGPHPTLGTSPVDLGKPNPLRYVLWGLGAVILAILAGVIVAMLVPGGPDPQIQIVSTPPGALVSLDGQVVGTTPITLTEDLEVGRSYDVEVTLPEHQVWRASIQAQQGVVQQSALLAPLPATLHVDTVPSGAQVLVGGAPRGTSPVDVVGYFVGQTVEVRASIPGGGPPVIQMVPITTAAMSVTVTIR